MRKRPPIVATKSNDPEGLRNGQRPAAAPLAGELALLDAKLAVLRAHGVASYQRDGEKETINLFPSPAPLSEAEETAMADKRAESMDEWERKMRYGASNGMRERS